MAAAPFRVAGLVLVVAALTAPAVAGEIYQWKDANGVTHYSDSPPANVKYRNRNLRVQEGTPVAAAEAKPVDSPSCVKARNNLARLKGSQPVGPDDDGDGKPDRTFTAEERAVQVEYMEAAAKAHCGSSPARTDATATPTAGT